MTDTPVLTPTFDTGARTKAAPMVAPMPDRLLDDDALAAAMPERHGNTPFIADLLSAVLAHEQCGRHLYRSVAGRSLNPMLASKYSSFGDETERHVTLLTDLIRTAGGDPMYVSPAARAMKASDTKLLESTFLLSGSVDLMTAEMVMLDAVLIAETIDHANWTGLDAIAEQLPGGEFKDQLRATVDEVLAEEDDHLEWARSTRLKMVSLQTKSRTIASAAASAESLVQRIKNLFD